MLAQYLVLLWAANAQKSKKRSDKAFDSPQARKEKKFHVHMLVESLYIVVPIYTLRQYFSLKLVLSLFLSLYQISDLCSYKIFLIKISVQQKRTRENKGQTN